MSMELVNLMCYVTIAVSVLFIAIYLNKIQIYFNKIQENTEFVMKLNRIANILDTLNEDDVENHED